jgi:hypothetical protein
MAGGEAGRRHVREGSAAPQAERFMTGCHAGVGLLGENIQLAYRSASYADPQTMSERTGRPGAVGQNVTVLYRGARWELGQGPGFFGIWAAGNQQSPPVEWWPQTPEGWQHAWSRFTGIEPPGAIGQAGPGAGAPQAEAQAQAQFHAQTQASGSARRAIVAMGLLAAGVACGIASLFPSYLGGASLTEHAEEILPHVIYLAAWTASAVLIWRGGSWRRAGTLLAIGTSIVTFGFFFTDAGTAIAGGSHLVGAGLVLGLAGWIACAAGSAAAFEWRFVGTLARPQVHQSSPVLTLMFATFAALGAAVTFAPSWDSFTLRTAAGVTQTVTAGNAFANPAPVIAGNVAVMVTLVAAAVLAAMWRPSRLGAALLAGASIPMLAQAISAVIQIGAGTSPLQFGISPAEAGAIGLTISSGLTASFWLYCAFIVALAATCWRMAMSPEPAAARLPQAPPAGQPGTRPAMPAAGPQEHPGAGDQGGESASSPAAAPGTAT